jgi:hypothetical protein
MKGIVILSVIFAVLVMSACRNTPKKSEEFVLADADSLSASFTTGAVADEEILRNFSSPIETANLFQVMGVPFTQEYLASSLDANELTSSFDKALSLGILGADLGYLNVYGKTGTSMDLLSSIKKLAEGLRVGQFFDFESIKRLSLNSSNFDSLLYLSIDSYNNIDKYLREDNRSQLSSLMIIGAWIEAQYFATQVMKQHPDDLLRDRIGEQKYFLNSLIRLAAPYCSMNDQFRTLCNYLTNIAAKYDRIKITYTQGNPVSSEKDGGLVITQTEASKVEMTDEQLAEIIEITGNVRNKLIVNN